MAIALVLVALLITGLPIFVCLGLTSLIFFYTNGISMDFLVRTLWNGVDKFPLIAVVGFLFVANLFQKAGITQALVTMVERFMASFRAGLAVITIVSCAIFAAVTGSGPATVATIGGLMIPAMIVAKYKPRFAGAVAASGGALGILIPPSNPFLMYGIIANQSIAELFTAGFIPGLLMALALSVTAALMLRWFPKLSTDGEEERKYQKMTILDALKAIWDAKWALIAIVLLLGGIYSGQFTPIEAAEVTIFYSLIVGFFINRTMKLKDVYEALSNTVRLTGTLLILVAAGYVFNTLLTMLGIPQALGRAIAGISQSRIVILLIIGAFMIFVGMWAETFSQIIILAPIFLPVVTHLGVDPIHFGVLFVVCAEIGFLTPPMGANLFVGLKIAKVSLESVSGAVIPFVITYIVVLVILVLFPDISMFLPNLIFR